MGSIGVFSGATHGNELLTQHIDGRSGLQRHLRKEVNSRGLGPADPTARVQNNIKRPNGASEIGEGQGNALWLELAPGAPITPSALAPGASWLHAR